MSRSIENQNTLAAVEFAQGGTSPLSSNEVPQGITSIEAGGGRTTKGNFDTKRAKKEKKETTSARIKGSRTKGEGKGKETRKEKRREEEEEEVPVVRQVTDEGGGNALVPGRIAVVSGTPGLEKVASVSTLSNAGIVTVGVGKEDDLLELAEEGGGGGAQGSDAEEVFDNPGGSGGNTEGETRGFVE